MAMARRYAELRLLYPQLSAGVLQSLTRYYRDFPSIARRITSEQTHIETALNDALSKLAVMMNVAVPSPHEFVFRARDLKRKNKGLLEKDAAVFSQASLT